MEALLLLSALLLVSCSSSTPLTTSANDHYLFKRAEQYVCDASILDGLKYGNVSARDSEGNTVIHVALGAKYSPHQEVFTHKDGPIFIPIVNVIGCGITDNNDMREGLKLLIAAGADVNATNKLGNTPLFYAGSVDAVQVLLDHGAKTDIHNKAGESILTNHAKKLHHPSNDSIFWKGPTIALIIEASSNPNQANRAGQSPIDILSQEPSSNTHAQEMLAMLIMNPQEKQLQAARIAQLPKLSPSELDNILQHAIKEAKEQVIQLSLLRMETKPSQASLLKAAYEAKQSKSAATILSIMPTDDIFWLSFAGMDEAAGKRLAEGNIPQAELDRALLECCTVTEPYKSTEDSGCCCTIDGAVETRQKNYKTIVALLEKYKAKDISPSKKASPDDYGRVLWMENNEDIKAELVRKLLTAGANPNAKDKKGITPLRYAMRAQDAKVMEMLLKAGANPNTKIEGGQSLLHLAKERATKDNEGSLGTDLFD